MAALAAPPRVHQVRYHGVLASASSLRLVTGGAALFGVGWGLGGFCPGPGLVSLAGFGSSAAVFVVFMFVGMVGHKTIHRPKQVAQSARVVETKAGAPC